MSFIQVQFGYNQTMVFNINCQVAPLLDAIEQQAYQEMHKAINKRQEWFNKEVQNMKKKEQKLLKRLDVLDAPKREEARLAAEAEAAASRPDLKKQMKGKRMTAKEKAAEEERLRKEEEERKAREEEEARLRAEEEERKRIAEEEKKAAAAKAKPAKGKKGQVEEPEEQVEETEEMKVEREKSEINAELQELRNMMKAFDEKAALCETNKTMQLEQAEVPKNIELNERTGERKHMRGSLDIVASELLRERKAYVLCQVLRNEQDEEYTQDIVVDGACMRTPEEDIKWAEEQAELEAMAAKAGGKKAAPKKK